MNMQLLLGIIISVIVVYSIVNTAAKAEHPVKKAFGSTFSGIAALAAVNLITPLTGVAVPISVVSVLTAVIGGVPGVTLIVFLGAYF